MVPLLQLSLVDSFGKGVMEESLEFSLWQDMHFSLGFKELLALGCLPTFSMDFTAVSLTVGQICLHSKGKHLSFSNLKLGKWFLYF